MKEIMIRDELFYIANTIQMVWQEWMEGQKSDALFSNELRNQIEKIRKLRGEIKSG